MPSKQKVPVLALVALALGVSLYHFVQGAWAAGASGFVDFPIFLANAAGFRETGVLYPFADDLSSYAPAAAVYKFPPLYALFLIPLVRHGIDDRIYVEHWALQLLLYAAAVAWLVTLLRGRRSSTFVVASLLVALNFEPFFETLWRLQIETPLLILLALAFHGLLRRREALTGMALGFAAMLKIYPGFLLLYFLQRRRWVVLAWSAAMALLVLVACLMIVGRQQNAVYYFEILPWMAREAPRLSSENLGLGRYLQSLLGVDPALAKNLGRLLALPLLALSVIAVRRHARRPPEPRGPVLELSLFLPLMLLLMPNSWVNYQLMLLPAILTLLAVGLGGRRPDPLLVGAAATAALLSTFYAPCAAPTVSWPCAQTPYWLGLVRLPRPVHDLFVDLRVLATSIVWGATLWRLWRPGEVSAGGAPGDEAATPAGAR